jgi:hypothetical protein
MPNIYFEELFEELGAPHPEPAINALPRWYRDMPKFFNIDPNREVPTRDFGTIRACPAVNDIMASGYVLYLPGDIFIDATGEEVRFNVGTFGNGSRIYEAGFELISLHDPVSTKGYQSMFEFHEQTLKWQTYWGIRTDEGYSTMFVHPFHRTDLPFYCASAIVDTDKFGTRSPYAFFIKKGFKGIIPRGTPMLQVIPFKREDWQMQIVEPDRKDYHRNQQRIASTFTQPYKKIFWQRKKYT